MPDQQDQFVVRSTGRVRGGLSLVEIIIVVAILAILASIVIPRFNSSSQMARVNATANDLRTFETAINVYAMKCNGVMPKTKGEFKTGIQAYLPTGALDTKPSIGGEFDFRTWVETNTAGIAISNAQYAVLFTELDKELDDGNLGTGRLVSTGSNEITFYVFGAVPD